MSGSLVVVGDALLDRDVEGRVERLCPEVPVPVVDALATRSRPGGAALAAALAASSGDDVTLVTALDEGPGGRQLTALLAAAGVEVIDLGGGQIPEKVRVRSGGKLLLRVDYGGRHDGRAGPLTGAAARALASAGSVLVSDYGRGLTSEPSVREALAARARGTPVVWDPHPRGREPVAGVTLATPNRSEAAALVADVHGDSVRDVAARARELRRRWSAGGVAITLGANGAVLVEGDDTHLVPAPPVVGGDVCGAGDRFAATAAQTLASGATIVEAVAEAVRAATAFVAAGGAGALELGPTEAAEEQAERARNEDAESLVARVRAAGGTVVATGGCFDLLHAGHVRTLEAARALGDCLVVCLNSDESVRALKGSDRPLVPQEDRASVLAALACVDAVVVFDEDTPEAVLERLRPDVWAKGGDYSRDELPEAGLVASWGGEVVILPYVEGRSTTRLLQEVAWRAG